MIDAHFHIWQLDRGDYAWLAEEDGRLRRDVSVEDWARTASPHGIRRGVLVQAAPTSAETRFILDAAARNPELVLGVVAWADLAADDAPAEVARLAAAPIVVAIRPWLQAIPDPDWILDASVASGLAAIADSRLAYEALVRPVHLPRIAEVVRRHPGLRVIVDHGAKPDIAADDFHPWATQLRRLAESSTSVFCKISGLLTEAGDRRDAASLRPYIETILEAFRPDRVMWGSDWPVVTTAAEYGTWIEMVRELTPSHAHDQVFEATARAAYALTLPATHQG